MSPALDPVVYQSSEAPEAKAFAAAVPSAKNVTFSQPINSPSRPTPHQIDEIVEHYQQMLDEVELAEERYADCKESLIALVQRFGTVPSGAEQSLRLEGRVNVLTVTTGSTISVKDDAVLDLFNAMKANKHVSLFYLMFRERMKYEKRKDAAVHLRTAKLSKRLIKLFTDLYARCTEDKKKSPSLKIERIDAKLAKKQATKKGGRS